MRSQYPSASLRASPRSPSRVRPFNCDAGQIAIEVFAVDWALKGGHGPKPGNISPGSSARGLALRATGLGRLGAFCRVLGSPSI
jgi:hypothetical protein